jgi:UDP-N-acetylmuramoyl-L-alanyl-D-glutamate--2,6-diaminopimelate ligase
VTDGHLYIEDALSRGAVAVASQREKPVGFGAEWIQVTSIRRFMALSANEFFGNPSHELHLIGITGTNGKTTTAFIAHSILDRVMPALLVGTVKATVAGEEIPSRLTTPESVDIQELLRTGLQKGCRAGAVEVSSHALTFDRVYRSHFPVAVFTNLSQDHLDFHQTLKSYFRTKAQLFTRDTNPGLRYGVINVDDPLGNSLAELCEAEVITYGFQTSAQARVREHSFSVEGIRMEIEILGNRIDLSVPLIGRHNVYNILAACTACFLNGVSPQAIVESVSQLPQIPGRFEKVELSAPFTVVIDYAHTPDALRNVLRLARTVAERRVICVFGAGGDRDKTKRPRMGKIAAENADYVIITSDNPRSEDPKQIICDITSGLSAQHSNFETITDRREAIRRALDLASENDLVLLAGKGHETYQEIGGKRRPFDERHVAREVLC